MTKTHFQLHSEACCEHCFRSKLPLSFPLFLITRDKTRETSKEKDDRCGHRTLAVIEGESALAHPLPLRFALSLPEVVNRCSAHRFCQNRSRLSGRAPLRRVESPVLRRRSHLSPTPQAVIASYADLCYRLYRSLKVPIIRIGSSSL